MSDRNLPPPHLAGGTCLVGGGLAALVGLGLVIAPFGPVSLPAMALWTLAGVLPAAFGVVAVRSGGERRWSLFAGALSLVPSAFAVSLVLALAPALDMTELFVILLEAHVGRGAPGPGWESSLAQVYRTHVAVRVGISLAVVGCLVGAVTAMNADEVRRNRESGGARWSSGFVVGVVAAAVVGAGAVVVRSGVSETWLVAYGVGTAVLFGAAAFSFLDARRTAGGIAVLGLSQAAVTVGVAGGSPLVGGGVAVALVAIAGWSLWPAVRSRLV